MDPIGPAEDQAWLRVMEIATICSVPMALKAAIHLRVMDILAQHAGKDEEHYLSATQIASHFRTQYSTAPSDASLSGASSSLDRILRVLASHGILASSLTTPTPSGRPVTRYGLNAVSSYLLQSDLDEGSLAPFVLLVQDPIFMQPFYALHESVIDGSVPFTKLYGMRCFSYMETDARVDQLFKGAMAGHTKLLMQALLETYNGFQDIHSLVDVGGGVGACLSMIASKHPHINGINFDLPHIIKEAPEYPGIVHVGGDMFTSIPIGEAIFMKWILHDWSDEHCSKILENCYKSLPKKGKVIVVDAVLPERVGHEVGARARYQMDLLMYANMDGGRERTKEEFECISKGSGFSRLQVICNIHGCSIIEIVKEV